MTCTVEMGSSARIYIPRFLNIGSAIQELMEEGRYSMEITYACFHFFKVMKVE
jgi:hypothetical protein